MYDLDVCLTESRMCFNHIILFIKEKKLKLKSS
jgi:hypothetical protein